MATAIANVGRILAAANLKTEDLCWLLTVTLGSKDYRFSSETVTITDADGVSHPYRGSLGDIEYSTAFELFSMDTDVPSIQLEVVFPDSVAALARDGVHLTSGTGELSLWVRGTELEDRVILVKGRLVDGSYGDDSEPVSFLLEGDAFIDNAIFPDPAATINAKTWPNAIDDSLGTSYPFVWGEPGAMTTADGAAIQVNGSPAYKVDTRKLLIAGHRVMATSVVIRDETDAEEATFTVDHEADGLGRICATVTLDPVSQPTAVTGHDFRVKWGANGGGIRSGRPGRVDAAMDDAGELLQFLLQQSTIKYDAGRLATVSAQLQWVKIAGYIGEQGSPWEWITDHLLPILPISIGVSGSEGIFPLLWPMNADLNDAVYALAEASAGEGNCIRASSVTYEDIDIANEITLEFAWGDHKNKPSAFTTVTGAPEEITASDLNAGLIVTTKAADGSPAGYVNTSASGWPDAYARFSHARHGRHATRIQSRIIYDRATAEAIVSWMARAKATPPRLIQYDVDTKLAWMQPGDVVTITDDGIRLKSQVALVRSVVFSETAVRLTLLIIEDPLRDSNDS